MSEPNIQEYGQEYGQEHGQEQVRAEGVHGVRLVKLPAEKPQAAAAFLRARSRGVMDLIAHFWERLSATPPLSRRDLHLVAALAGDSNNIDINMQQVNPAAFSGAMLYVPKAHRADVLALDERTAGAFAAYIGRAGRAEGHAEAPRPPASPPPSPAAAKADVSVEAHAGNGTAAGNNQAAAGPGYALTDLSGGLRGQSSPLAAEGTGESAEAGGESGPGNGNGKAAIDFLTGDAQGIQWMTHLLLPMVHRRAPARELVNVVMQLPAEVACTPDASVRLARETDIPMLNRWRRQYKEERGILFDADMDAWVQHQRVFVYELPAEAAGNGQGRSAETGATATGAGGGGGAGTVVAVAKMDLDLQDLVEIGGVYTFPEYRQRGYGAGIVRDLAFRIRQMNKTPTLQVDERNSPALRLYSGAGWKEMGRLARVWLTG